MVDESLRFNTTQELIQYLGWFQVGHFSNQMKYNGIKKADPELVEGFLVMGLDICNYLLTSELVELGSFNRVMPSRKNVFRSLLSNKQVMHVVLVHNHPDGDPKPSPEDYELTERYKEVATLLGFTFRDHIIIGRTSSISLVENKKYMMSGEIISLSSNTKQIIPVLEEPVESFDAENIQIFDRRKTPREHNVASIPKARPSNIDEYSNIPLDWIDGKPPGWEPDMEIPIIRHNTICCSATKIGFWGQMFTTVVPAPEWKRWDNSMVKRLKRNGGKPYEL